MRPPYLTNSEKGALDSVLESHDLFDRRSPNGFVAPERFFRERPVGLVQRGYHDRVSDHCILNLHAVSVAAYGRGDMNGIANEKQTVLYPFVADTGFNVQQRALLEVDEMLGESSAISVCGGTPL